MIQMCFFHHCEIWAGVWGGGGGIFPVRVFYFTSIINAVLLKQCALRMLAVYMSTCNTRFIFECVSLNECQTLNCLLIGRYTAKERTTLIFN